MRRRTLPLMLTVFAALAACQTNREPKGRWQEATVNAPSDGVLWTLSLLALRNRGFPIPGGLDPASGEVTSGWKTELHPFQGEGYRERAEVRFRPLEPGSWEIRARVARQTNENLTNPLDASRAEWEWAADDPHSALIMLTHIRSRLGTELEFEEKKDPLEALLERVEALENE